jgi:DNA-binding MurR/RpiR family transcriptional regulator
MAMSDFNRKLKLVNLWSNDYFEHYSIKRIADISTKEDVIIVFSLGGRTEEVNQSVYEAKQNGTRILSITSLGNTYLSQLSDGVIYVYDTIKKHEKLRSRLMFNLVGTLLFEVILDELAKGDI